MQLTFWGCFIIKSDYYQRSKIIHSERKMATNRWCSGDYISKMYQSAIMQSYQKEKCHVIAMWTRVIQISEWCRCQLCVAEERQTFAECFSTSHCEGWFSDTQDNVTFPINLAVLRHYFQEDEMSADVNAAIELNDTVFVKLPLWR